MKRTIILALATVMAVSALAQTQSAKGLLKQYNDADKAAIDQAMKTRDFAGYAKANEQALQAVKDALKSVDPTKVDPKDAYDWAQLYSLTQDHKIVCDLTHSFLTTNPGPKEKFQDQMLMMQSCNALGEADMLKSTLVGTTPPTPDDCTSFAFSATRYVGTIADKQGDKEGLKLLDKIQKEITLPDPKAAAQERLDKEKASPSGNTENTDQPAMTDDEKLQKYEQQAVGRNEQVMFGFANERAKLLMDEGNKGKALTTLQDYESQNPSLGKGVKHTLDMTINQLKDTGAPELALTAERTVGQFTSLADLKGKVVLVDFFAHWCGPCMASVPSMVSMYGELHSKGLEIVGVTQYYGYFGNDKNLSKDDEFSKLQGLLNDKNMTWPIVVGPKDNATQYGVYGIPETVLIDKNGVVRNIWVGYIPAQEEKIKETVEKLLQE